MRDAYGGGSYDGGIIFIIMLVNSRKMAAGRETLNLVKINAEGYNFMILVIGGAYCGKSSFIKSKFHIEDKDIVDGEDLCVHNIEQYRVISNLEKYIEKILRDNDNVNKQLELLLLNIHNSNLIIEMREMGSGIVPIDMFARTYREYVGRFSCDIAEKAEAVYRVVCGLGMKIK